MSAGAAALGLPAVCDGLPPDFLLRGLGSWSSSCDGKTKSNQACQAKCVEFGAASITCRGFEWALETFTGGCLTNAGGLGWWHMGL